MKKLGLFLFALLLVASLVYAADNQCLQNAQQNSSVLYFFYGDGCPHCAAAEPFLLELGAKYNLTIIYHETWHNSTNEQIFEQFLAAYSVPKNSWGVPGFFMGSKYIIGFDNAQTTGKDIENIVSSCLNNSCQENQSQSIKFSFFGKNFELSKNSPVLFIGAVLGFIDGLFPCNLAILLFLMSYLFTISASKKKILKMGLVFILVIFIVYALLMLGLINIIGLIPFKSAIQWIVKILLIVMGLINIKDFFFKGVGPSLEIPKFAKPSLEGYVQKATIPAVIVLAVLLSLVTLGCTFGVPLAYVTLLSGKAIVGFSGFVYILWYCLFYILPLLVIVLLIYFLILEADKAEEYRQKLKGYVKLIGGLLMIILALLFI